jgi:hypothetical protein
VYESYSGAVIGMCVVFLRPGAPKSGRLLCVRLHCMCMSRRSLLFFGAFLVEQHGVWLVLVLVLVLVTLLGVHC